MNKKLVNKIVKHFNKKIRINFGEKNAWTGREFGDYFIVGINTSKDIIEVNLRSTESGVSMWYEWKEEYKFIN